MNKPSSDNTEAAAHSQGTSPRFALLAVLIALVSSAAGVALWQMAQNRAPEVQSLLILPEPRPIGEFHLNGADGKPFGSDRLRGKWTLVFFGFTHCPDVCPTTLYDLKQLKDTIRETEPDEGGKFRILFVSVDPERDTPQRLGEYLAYFDPDFIGATGDRAELDKITRAMSTAYRIEPHESGNTSYAVDHSASVLLTDPRGRLYGVFPAPLDPQRAAQDLLSVMD